MNNFELIDDYLTNKLGEAEKAAFEKQLESDPALKADVALQNQILEGVRKARAAELKTMLQNVPIGGSAISWPVLRMAAGIVGAGVLIAGLSYYFRSHENINPSSLSTSIEDSIKQKEKTTEPMEEKKVESTLEEAKNNESVKVVEKKKPVEKKKEEPIKGIIIDRERYAVYKDNLKLQLPRKEFELLSLLASKPGKVFTRDEILERVWGNDVIVGDRTIDVHVRKLREKFGDEYIRTIKGIGYKFDF